VFPPQKDFTLTDWWLSLFKFAPNYTQEAIQGFEQQGIIMPSIIAQALERLYFPKWNPQEINEYKTDTIEKEKYAVEFASERAEGREENAREIAMQLVIDGMPLEKVAKMTKLDIEIVQDLAKEAVKSSRENV